MSSYVNAESTSDQTVDPQLPLLSFVKDNDYLEIKLSPDGEHLAARVRDNDTVYMFVFRVSDNVMVGGAKPSNKDVVASVDWVSNKRLVYTFAEKRYDFDAAVPTGELFAIDFDGKRNAILAGMRASDANGGSRIQVKENSKATHKLLNVLPNDKGYALIVEHPWSKKGDWWYDRRERNPIVSKIDIYSGRKTDQEIIPFRGASVFANDQGEVNFVTWSEDSVNFKAAYRASKKHPWQDISSILSSNSDDLTATGVNAAGTKAYLVGGMTDQGIRTLFELDLASKKLTKVFDTSDNLIYWQADEDGDPVIGVAYPDKARYHYSVTKPKSPLIRQHKQLVRAFKGQDAWITSESTQSNKLVLNVESDINPGEYYLVNTEKMSADFLWASYSWVDPREMSPMQAIELPARDGQVLKGYITAPKSPLGAKKPMVVLPHGGPHGVRDFPFYNPEVQLLANRGYTVLQINFRGSGGYGGEFQSLGFKQWGKSMVDDVIDATHWAIGKGYADKDKICIYGANYGGFSALMSAIRAPDLYQCAVGYVGVYDLRAMKTKGDIPIGFRGRKYLQKALGSDLEDLAEQSPVTHADKIKADVLLIHGDEDVRVPSYHAKKMRSALEKAGNKPEWLYLGDAGHGARSIKNRTKVYEALLKFLDKHIGQES